MWPVGRNGDQGRAAQCGAPDYARGPGPRGAVNTILPLALVVVVIGLLLILRPVLFTALVLLVVGFSIVTALGLSVWLGMAFSPVVGMAPSMILTLALADCSHLLTTYRQQRLSGQPWRPAIPESLRINVQPIWLTSVTTALGFAILNFAQSHPFRALGNVVVLGVLAAFGLSVVLLPALISLVPHGCRPGIRPAGGNHGSPGPGRHSVPSPAAGRHGHGCTCFAGEYSPQPHE